MLLTLPLMTACTLIESSKIDKEPFVISNTYRATPESQSGQTKAGEVWRGQLTGLFSDQRAKSIGDIVTVKIIEVSQASEKATTDTSRSSELSAGIPDLMGLEAKSATGIFSNPSSLLSANTKNTFTGSGETTRSGSLSATITARIMEVLPNGNLAIEGKREIYVNNEKKEILLQGIVRPRDITYDNSVLSTQVADAKIIYTGVGIVGEKQKSGWASKIFDYVWPF